MTTAAELSRINAIKITLSIARGFQRKPRPAEMDLLVERVRAAIIDLSECYGQRQVAKAKIEAKA
jgi:hypothetical protein